MIAPESKQKRTFPCLTKAEASLTGKIGDLVKPASRSDYKKGELIHNLHMMKNITSPLTISYWLIPYCLLLDAYNRNLSVLLRAHSTTNGYTTNTPNCSLRRKNKVWSTIYRHDRGNSQIVAIQDKRHDSSLLPLRFLFLSLSDSNMPCFHRTNCCEQNNCDWIFWRLRLPCCTSEESLRCFKDIDCIACAPLQRRRRRRKKMQRNSCSSFQETTLVRHRIPSLSSCFCFVSSFPHFASAS